MSSWMKMSSPLYLRTMSLEEHNKKSESTIVDEKTVGPELYRPEVDVSTVDERKLMRKIDWHIVPWMSVLYLLSYMDRANIGNARVCSLNRLCIQSIVDTYIIVVQYAERFTYKRQAIPPSANCVLLPLLSL